MPLYNREITVIYCLTVVFQIFLEAYEKPSYPVQAGLHQKRRYAIRHLGTSKIRGVDIEF